MIHHYIYMEQYTVYDIIMKLNGKKWEILHINWCRLFQMKSRSPIFPPEKDSKPNECSR